MAITSLLVFSWLMTYLLVGNTVGALMLVILVTAAILSMGSRIPPAAGAVAVAAVLVGALMQNLGLDQYLIPTLAAGLGVGIFWQLTRTRSTPPMEGTA